MLASVLAAILVNQRVRFRNPVCCTPALFGSIALAIALPPASLLIEPTWLRYVVAAALAFAPIFFANLVFSYSFRDTKAADMAFASNLLGAVVGGAIEYVALVTGYWLAAGPRRRALPAGVGCWPRTSGCWRTWELTSSTDARLAPPTSSQVEVPQ